MGEELYFLKSDRLGFRQWTDSDLPSALGLWGDPEVTKLIGGPYSEAQVEARLGKEMGFQRDYGFQYWPIFLWESGEHVGCCGLRPYQPEKSIPTLGYHLRKAFWGQGFAAEAAKAVVNYAFDHLDVAGLFAGHHPDNTASKRVLIKLGFQFTHEEYFAPTGLMHPSYLLMRVDDV